MIRVVTIGALLVLCTAAILVSQNGSDLYQQAYVRQTANGDAQGAIPIYERIVREFSSNRPLVAKALLQLGKCYESMGQSKSREYYDQVVSQYGDQTEMVAEAKNRLAAAQKTVLQITTPPTENSFSFAIAPDGRSMVFAVIAVGKGQLWLHHFDTGRAGPIPGTDGAFPVEGLGFPAAVPFWSPDSKFIGYFNDGKLKRIPVEGGAAQILADAPDALGGTWSRDGIIVFSLLNGSGGLRRMPADGSAPEVSVGIGAGECPKFLPDGHHFLFLRRNEAISRGQVAQVLSIGSLDSREVRVLPVQAYAGTFADPDQLLYATDQGLFARRLDAATLELTGTPVRISERVALVPGTCGLAASASTAGTLTYRNSTSPGERQLVWIDRQGRQTGSFLPDPSLSCCARISPDGRTVTFGRFGGGAPAGSAWVIDDTPGTEARRIIAGAKISVWSPTGDSLVLGLYRAQPPFGPYLAMQLLNGPTNPRLLRPSDSGEQPTDWSMDGRYLLYQRVPSGGLLVVPLQGSPAMPAGQPIPVAQTPANEKLGRFSPDSKWIVYQSNEPGGRDEIFVQPFPGSINSRKRISVDGGTAPAWRRNDGHEIYFISPDSHLMVASVKVSENGQDIAIGTPVPLFPSALPAGSEFDVSSDGQRFLINRPGESITAPITVLPNWTKAK